MAHLGCGVCGVPWEPMRDDTPYVDDLGARSRGGSGTHVREERLGNSERTEDMQVVHRRELGGVGERHGCHSDGTSLGVSLAYS